MENKVVLVTDIQSAFARHTQFLGLSVRDIREPATKDEQWEAIYWEQASMTDFVERNRIISHLLKAPKGCIRILDFNIRNIGTTEEQTIDKSLEYCDLLKIGKQEMLMLCNLFGIATKSIFDCSFEIMAHFDIKTLILNHGNRGCHVFHGTYFPMPAGISVRHDLLS